MSHSTPLDQIENETDNRTEDDARVQRIIQEMKGGGSDESPGQQKQPQQQQYQQQMYQEQQQQQQPPMYQQQQQQPPMYQPPQQQQQGYHMYQPPHVMPPQQLMGPGMVPYHNENMESNEHYEQHNTPPPPPPAAEAPAPSKKNIWAHITDALKLPVVVAFVFFILSLPIVDTNLSKYASWAFSSGGQLSISGIALKAAVAGTVMGIYDMVDSLISRFL